MTQMSDLSAADVSGRRFARSWMGYRAKEVDSFLSAVADRLTLLEDTIDKLAGRLAQMGDRDLRAEFDAISEEVGAVLQSAREAADGLRARTAEESDRWRREAAAETEKVRREARVDAEALRGDAWSTAEKMLEESQAARDQMASESRRDSLAITGQAERDAHKLVAAARRESEDQLRVAKMESERLVVDSRTRADEIIEQARTAAETAQERARALEVRRQELLEELEVVRSTVQRLETDIERKRDTTEVTRPEESPDEEELEPPAWQPDETIRIIPEGKPRFEESVDLDATEVAEEVRQLREEPSDVPPGKGHVTVLEPAEEAKDADSEPEGAEEAASADVDVQVVGEEAETEEAPAKEPAEEPAEAVGGFGIDTLFDTLRTEPTATAAEVEGTKAPAKAAVLTATDPFELRDRLVLPITTRVLRNVKRQLTDEQNLALEAVRIDAENWKPALEGLAERIRPDLTVIVQESFAAGVGASSEFTGVIASRPKPEKGDIVDHSPEFAVGLSDTLESLTNGLTDPADLAAAVTRAYRTWRTDEAERRARGFAFDAYHRGLLRGLKTAGVTEFEWEISGRGCSDCREAAETDQRDVEEALSGGSLPPVHGDCGCTVVPRTG